MKLVMILSLLAHSLLLCICGFHWLEDNLKNTFW